MHLGKVDVFVIQSKKKFLGGLLRSTLSPCLRMTSSTSQCAQILLYMLPVNVSSKRSSFLCWKRHSKILNSQRPREFQQCGSIHILKTFLFQLCYCLHYITYLYIGYIILTICLSEWRQARKQMSWRRRCFPWATQKPQSDLWFKDT